MLLVPHPENTQAELPTTATSQKHTGLGELGEVAEGIVQCLADAVVGGAAVDVRQEGLRGHE
eukprot:13327926-Alexandrium_andersonii.AAC.1